MYHGDANERQRSELHMVRKEGGMEKVAGAGPVHCRFSIPPSFLTMCSSERCLSLASPWYIDHLNHHYS